MARPYFPWCPCCTPTHVLIDEAGQHRITSVQLQRFNGIAQYYHNAGYETVLVRDALTPGGTDYKEVTTFPTDISKFKLIISPFVGSGGVIADLDDWLAMGGKTYVVTAEFDSPSYAGSISTANSILSGLGSAMEIIPASHFAGVGGAPVYLTGETSHAMSNGLDVGFALGSVVDGGDVLFQDGSSNVAMAAEMIGGSTVVAAGDCNWAGGVGPGGNGLYPAGNDAFFSRLYPP